MYKINFQKPNHIHFIGIGGISMSGLAEILMQQGFEVSGSDSQPSALTAELENKGATVIYKQAAANISKDISCVVYTAAISRKNPELIEAIAKKIPLLTRAELLGQIMIHYQNAIAVAGTHGKTTTTSMISHVLLAGDKDPTISVGGILPIIGGNIRVGQSDTFITEACEYTNSFLDFHPKIGIILNIEEDHLDFFKDLEDIRQSFRLFIKRIPPEGTVIINGQIDNYQELFEGLPAKVITYGLSRSFDYGAENITFNEEGHVSFDFFRYGQKIRHIQLSVTGEHNASNALTALAIGDLLDINVDKVDEGLASFIGTKRRFEYKGKINGVTIIDDYAHHPTEIRATLEAARHYPHRELWVVFQPHTYTRTKVFFTEFARTLAAADHLILTDIYAARETDDLGVTSALLAEAAKEFGGDVHYYSSFTDIKNFVLENCAPGDLLITMGAGNIVNLGEELIK